MKKFLFTMVAALLAIPSFAQMSRSHASLDASNLYFGGRLGMAVSTLTGDVDMGARVGLTLGAVIGMQVNESVFLESGLYYSERGAKDGSDYVHLNTIEIPVVAKYGIMATDDIALLPFLGPVFSYGIGGKTKILGTKYSTYNDLSHSNFSIKLGCGIEYKSLYGEIGYQIGVTNLFDDDVQNFGNATGSDFTTHSNALLINVGVNF